MKWFKHDSTACMDSKLKRVRMKYGMEGYGVYWLMLELISGTIDKNNLKFELEYDAELLSGETNIHRERIQEMMSDFVQWGLFDKSGEKLTCQKMSLRTDEYTQKLINSNKKTQSELVNVPTIFRLCPDNIRLNRKEENRTEENIKNIGEFHSPDNFTLTNTTLPKKQKRFLPPSIDDIKIYCQSRHNDIDPEQFHDFYQSKGWLIGKNPMKDWQAAVRTWERHSVTPKSYNELDNAI